LSQGFSLAAQALGVETCEGVKQKSDPSPERCLTQGMNTWMILSGKSGITLRESPLQRRLYG
jgi:hypothetical protein